MKQWIMEFVVDHEPHVIPLDKRHLRFRVRFRGLPDTHDRMYPWAQMHTYVRADGLARLTSIPVIVGMTPKRVGVFFTPTRRSENLVFAFACFFHARLVLRNA
jgi:hypothetical protein